MTTNGNETTTQHDYRPTHPVRPTILAELRERQTAAWAEYDQAVDALYDGRGTDADKTALLERANAADAEYHRACNDPATWEQGECTCLPNSVSACPACVAETQGDEIPFI